MSFAVLQEKDKRIILVSVLLFVLIYLCYRMLYTQLTSFMLPATVQPNGRLVQKWHNYSKSYNEDYEVTVLTETLPFFNYGETEVEQFRYYKQLVKYNNSLLQTLSTRTPSSYTFQVLDVNVFNYSLTFIVDQEDFNGPVPYLIGGASFYVTVIGECHWSTCRTTDSFSGRYVVECPMYDACVNVTASVYFVDYGAFRYEDLGDESHNIFWSKTVCKATVDGVSDYAIGLRSQTYIGWYRTNSSSEWMWVRRGRTAVKSREELKKCLSNVTAPVYMLGDSHLRQVYYYVVDLLGLPMPEQFATKLRSSSHARNVHYTFVTSLLEAHGPEFAAFLPYAYKLFSKFPKPASSSFDVTNQTQQGQGQSSQFAFGDSSEFNKGRRRAKPSVFMILCVGTWDVSLYSADYFIDTVIPALTNFTQELWSRGSVRGVKVIFLTMPASFNGPRQKHRSGPEGRNNARLAALNRLLTEKLVAQGVAVVDFFALTITRHTEAFADGYHYPTTPGMAGDAVARLVLQELCG